MVPNLRLWFLVMYWLLIIKKRNCFENESFFKNIKRKLVDWKHKRDLISTKKLWFIESLTALVPLWLSIQKRIYELMLNTKLKISKRQNEHLINSTCPNRIASYPEIPSSASFVARSFWYFCRLCRPTFELRLSLFILLGPCFRQFFCTVSQCASESLPPYWALFLRLLLLWHTYLSCLPLHKCSCCSLSTYYWLRSLLNSYIEPPIEDEFVPSHYKFTF